MCLTVHSKLGELETAEAAVNEITSHNCPYLLIMRLFYRPGAGWMMVEVAAGGVGVGGWRAACSYHTNTSVFDLSLATPHSSFFRSLSHPYTHSLQRGRWGFQSPSLSSCCFSSSLPFFLHPSFPSSPPPPSPLDLPISLAHALALLGGATRTGTTSVSHMKKEGFWERFYHPNMLPALCRTVGLSQGWEKKRERTH